MRVLPTAAPNLLTKLSDRILHVNGVEKEDVILQGEHLKISRPRKKEFLQALAKDRKSTRLNSSHVNRSRMPSSA